VARSLWATTTSTSFTSVIVAAEHYGDIRRSETADGFVQQHVLRLTRQDGTRVELPGCIIATCADGKITRIDEYLDSAQVARLVG